MEAVFSQNNLDLFYAVHRVADAALVEGDCLQILKLMPDNSVDSIVTDPPYGLSFMGKKWDYDVPSTEVWAECLRVLKPGGHLLAFAGTRTQHRMAVRIEDAGFEIRDMIAWVYGSGFPKSLDVSKAIDKLDASEAQERRRLEFTAWVRSQGVTSRQIDEATGTNMGGHYTTAASQPAIMTREHLEACRHLFREVPEWVEREADQRTVESENFKRREVIGVRKGAMSGWDTDGGTKFVDRDITAPTTDAARQWQGWGTALKPALEPITVARKPLVGTVAENVLVHGTGALNVDGCRVATDDDLNGRGGSGWHGRDSLANNLTEPMAATQGRWPANLIHDGSEEVLAGFPSDKQGSAARFFQLCEGVCDSIWQDQNPTTSSAGIAVQSSCLLNHLAATVQNAVAIWPSLAGILSSEQTAASTPVTLNESKAISETAMQAMSSIASGFSQESQHERRTPCGSLVRTAATQRPTGTTTITTSLCKSDGSVGVATFTITPSNLDRGEAVYRFNYCAKASKRDRDEGLEGFTPAKTNDGRKVDADNAYQRGATLRANTHPTVKPTDLMAYLCRLVTPPGGVVLDPFMGSGSTGKAAMREGFRFIGCELSPEYMEIARARIASAVKN